MLVPVQRIAPAAGPGAGRVAAIGERLQRLNGKYTMSIPMRPAPIAIESDQSFLLRVDGRSWQAVFKFWLDSGPGLGYSRSPGALGRHHHTAA